MHQSRRVPARIAGLTAGVLALGGCATLERAPEPPPPAPLELLSAAPLELPQGCEPAVVVYRTEYVVETDGRVTGARSESGDGCVQQALRSWVSSFRYAPVEAPMAVVIDWLAVTASRGG